MVKDELYDVIIIGGSYAGLAAAMTLGRALRNVLIIDSARPCNRQTPHSHNFLTQDGNTPGEIGDKARRQVAKYDTVQFLEDEAIEGSTAKNGFVIETASGGILMAKKLIFASGIADILPDIAGISECWGISVLHCPYCHGFEVRNERTGILDNGSSGFDFARFVSNWTGDLTLFTNGPTTLTGEQSEELAKNDIMIVEKEINAIEHDAGYLRNIIFKDGMKSPLKALYIRSTFRQHSVIPENLGCTLNDAGYIQVDETQMTSIEGIYACGDNASGLRTVANAVAMGTKTGMKLGKALILEEFKI